MRRRAAIVLVALLAAVALALGGLITSALVEKPLVHFGSPVYTNRLGQVTARLPLTNASAYRLKLGDGAFVRMESQKGWTTNHLPSQLPIPGFTPPRGTFRIQVVLPPGTIRWQGGYELQIPSARSRAVRASGWRGAFLRRIDWALSNEPGDKQKVQSEVFEIPPDVAESNVAMEAPVPFRGTSKKFWE